jgi:hypothetical protein
MAGRLDGRAWVALWDGRTTRGLKRVATSRERADPASQWRGRRRGATARWALPPRTDRSVS